MDPRRRGRIAVVVAWADSGAFSGMLEEHGGNLAEASAASGIARRYFQLLEAR